MASVSVVTSNGVKDRKNASEKSNLDSNKKSTVYVKPHKWEFTGGKTYADYRGPLEIRAWGLTPNSEPVVARFRYLAPLIIELDARYQWDESGATRLYHRLMEKMSEKGKTTRPVTWEFVTDKKPLYSAYLRTGKVLILRYDNWFALDSLKWALAEKKDKNGNITNPDGMINLWDGHPPIQLKVRNEKVTPDIAFLYEHGLETTTWFQFEGTVVKSGRETRLDLEYVVPDPKYVSPTPHAVSAGWKPQMKMLFMDVEANSERSTSMPKAHNPADAAFCIGVTLRHRDGKTEMHAFCSTKKPNKPPGVEIHYFDDEEKAIVAFAHFLRDSMPDAICTHNGLGWDEDYLWHRMLFLREKWPNDSRVLNHNPFLDRREWESSAYQGMRFRWVDRPGVLHIDLLPWSKRSLNRLDSYRLDYLDKKFGGKGKLLGDEDVAKVDLDDEGGGDENDDEQEDYLEAHRIFEYYGRGDPEDLKRIVIYCVGCTDEKGEMVLGDCGITMRLIDKLQVWMSVTQMAKVAFVQPFDVLTKGMQARTYNQVAREAHKRNMYMTMKEAPDRIPVKGAHVFPPMRGIWKLVFTFDFKGLYPSIIRRYNLCWTTYVPKKGDPNYNPGYDDPSSPLYVSDDRCHIFEWTEDWHTDEYEEWKKGNKKKSAKKKWKGPIMKIHHRHRVLKEPRGILPANLDKLATDRDIAKKEMKKYPEGSHEYNLWNKEQDAIKLVMNSAYGGLGSDQGPLPCHPLAAIVTYVARCSAQKMAKYYEDTYEARVVYGDSVTPDTPILCRLEGENGEKRVLYRTIDELGNGEWEESEHGEGKEECAPLPGLEVWTESGFTPIRKVIRHICGKPLKRVLTHTGVVDVTTDHSLLTPTGEKIRPTDVQIGTRLLHSDLPIIPDENVTSLTPDQAYAWGLFYAEGSCGSYGEGHDIKHSWAISNLDTRVFERAIRGLEQSESRNTFRILDTVASSGVYKLTAFGEVAQLTRRWRPLFYDKDKCKKVPDEILTAPRIIRQAFWEGYYAGDGDKDPKGYIRCDNKGKLGAAGLYYLATSLGYPVSINTRVDKPHIYRLTCIRNGRLQRKQPDAIKKIGDLPAYDGYVFDLETENHHFAAGIGRMIVHNTDSAFVWFPPHQVEKHDIEKDPHAWGHRMAKEGSALFEKPMELDFEKVFAWLILVNKKQYVGPIIPAPDFVTREYKKPVSWKLEDMISRGLMFVKRGAAPVMQEMQKELVLLALTEAAKGTPMAERQQKAMAAIEAFSYRLMSHGVPEKELTITQKIGQNYKEETNHLNVFRLHLVSKGKIVNPGDRVPYVLVKRRKSRAQELAEEAEKIARRKAGVLKAAATRAAKKRGEVVIKTKTKPAKKTANQGEKMESPEFRKESGDPIDYLYYLEKRGVKPYDAVLTPGFNLTNFMKWHVTFLKVREKTLEELRRKYRDEVEKHGERDTARLDRRAYRERKRIETVVCDTIIGEMWEKVAKQKQEFGSSVAPETREEEREAEEIQTRITRIEEGLARYVAKYVGEE